MMEKNPFKKGSPEFNLTEQGKMLREEPAKARFLMAQEKWNGVTKWTFEFNRLSPEEQQEFTLGGGFIA
jgi:hypothetical protein